MQRASGERWAKSLVYRKILLTVLIAFIGSLIVTIYQGNRTIQSIGLIIVLLSPILSYLIIYYTKIKNLTYK